MTNYDVIVIGSGPGGYVAAIKCAQLGFKTAIIEKYSSLGGTCLNVGCIPSKALLDSSHHYHNAIHNFPKHGINVTGNIEVDINKMIDRKKEVVSKTVEGINSLMKKNKIDVFIGTASFKDNNSIKISAENDEKILNSKYFIIATGSKPNFFTGMQPDKKRIITSTEALNMTEIPKSMIIIGAGVIGLELGSVYARLGTKIKVVEFMDSIIPTMDYELGKELGRSLKKDGFEFYLEHKVQNVENKDKNVELKALDKNNKEIVLEAEYCLVAVGRKPFTDGLDVQAAGIEIDEKGRIKTNDSLRTNIDNIYAIGDVINGPMLAHKASEEGIFVAEILSGQKPHINYNLIPSVVYTWPEVASVGNTEKMLKDKNIDYKIGKFPMKALGRARASDDTDGFVKILADKNTDEVLGIHIISARAADIIADAVTLMEYRASAEDISRFSHAHPSFAEALKEAALLAFDSKAIHI